MKQRSCAWCGLRLSMSGIKLKNKEAIINLEGIQTDIDTIAAAIIGDPTEAVEVNPEGTATRTKQSIKLKKMTVLMVLIRETPKRSCSGQLRENCLKGKQPVWIN